MMIVVVMILLFHFSVNAYKLFELVRPKLRLMNTIYVGFCFDNIAVL